LFQAVPVTAPRASPGGAPYILMQLGASVAAVVAKGTSLVAEQPAAFTTAIYCVAFEVARRRAVAALGSENLGGTPKWRSVVGLIPQAVVMPSLLIASWLVPTARDWAQQMFINVFGALLLFDFAALSLNPMMIAHHGTCLAGHVYAALTAPEAFGFYFASVVALEAGSATSCAWWVWGEERFPRALTAAYVVGMTISNLLAIWALLRWYGHATSLPLIGRGAPVLITAVLVYFRQAEMHHVVYRGRGASSTG